MKGIEPPAAIEKHYAFSVCVRAARIAKAADKAALSVRTDLLYISRSVLLAHRCDAADIGRDNAAGGVERDREIARLERYLGRHSGRKMYTVTFARVSARLRRLDTVGRSILLIGAVRRQLAVRCVIGI